MRPDDFEDRLRAALQARAGDVAPNPETWARVRERMQRRSRVRWMAAAAAVAPLVALVAAVAGLGLLDRQPDVTQPAASPTPSAAASPSASPAAEPPLVLAAPPGIALADATGRVITPLFTDAAGRECRAEPEGCEAARVLTVSARPGGVQDEPTVAFLERSAAQPCWGSVAVLRAGAGPWRFEAERDCPTAPLWSPEGRFVGWLESGDDRVEFAYTAWNQAAAAPYGPGYVSLVIEGAETLIDLRLHDWVWTDEPAATPSGLLVVTAVNGEGEIEAFQIPIRRPRPDEFALELAGPIEPLPGGRYVLAYADGAQARISAEGPSYAIQRAGGGLVLTASADGDRSAEVALPDELLDPAGPDGSLVWLVASGGTVLFGDGVDQAWRARFDGNGWGPLAPLPGEVREADLLVSRPPP